jgi:DNA-binding response OmpR family regulator
VHRQPLYIYKVIEHRQQVIQVANLRLEPCTWRAWAGENQIESLTAAEYAMLFLVAREQGRVVTLDEIGNFLDGASYDVIRALAAKVRKKVGSAAVTIRTVHGVGFQLVQNSGH